MLIEARDVMPDLVADVVIVGAGPAGLTVASELGKAGADVLLLESGGLPYDRSDRHTTLKALRDHLAGAQSSTRGSTSGEPYFPLRLSRARGIGGSANALKAHGLRGRPLDPIDFTPRFGVSWPIGYDDVKRFLPDAEVYCGIRSAIGRPVDWTPSKLSLGGVPSAIFEAAPFRHGERRRFANEGLVLSGNASVRFVTGATVVGVETDGIGSVTGLEVGSAGGGLFHVVGRNYVVATGGIDNARLLLSSRPVQYLMGPAAEQIGRSFMEHLHYVPAVLIPESPVAADELRTLCGDGDHADNWLTLDDETVAAGNLLRVAFLPVPINEASLEPSVPAFGDFVRMMPFGPFGLRGRARQAAVAAGGLHHVARAIVARMGAGGDPRPAFALAVMAEQAPDPASRITAGAGVDRMGLPLPHLHWRVGRRDFADARRSTDLLAAEMDRMGVGKVVSLWDRGEDRPPVVSGGWHHMGTTRMSADDASGVVDGDCGVHGLDNLFIAGSSVFPTSGYANPTLTLVALAVRLGRHLAGR